MFKNTDRHLKAFIFPVIFSVLLLQSVFPQKNANCGTNDLENYIELNEKEQRLIDFKDTEESLKLKLIQLDIINKSRMRHNALPVKLDILASRVANKMCREAAENGYIGHWNLAGEEPYLRYAFAGGLDHVSENAYGEWSSDKYNVSLIGSLMESGHAKFMAERSPYDGHRQNIIDKSHNWVGIGFCLSGRQFRYYEEFIDRYFEFENIPDEVRIGEKFSIKVSTNRERYLYYLVIYREDWPHPLTPEQISRKGSYRDYTGEIYKDIYPWDLSAFRDGSSYEIPLSFSKEGFYYIQIFSDPKEISKPASFNTKGKEPESGLVIKVHK